MKSRLALALALAACSPVFGIQGSGVEKTETRAVPPFERISVAGSAETVVKVGGTPSVTVTCDDNLLPHVRTRVVDGTLELEVEGGNHRFQRGLRFEVSAPRLTGVSVAGSGKIEVVGVETEAFEVSIAGSGDVRAAGRAQRVTVDVAGSGDAELFALAAEAADVEIAGSGDVRISAAKELHVEIAGSGSVHYRGEPHVKKSIAGSGEVAKD